MNNTADVLAAMEAKGPITPSRLLREAAKPNHPLHNRFEWDNSKAAHEYRLIQARKIIVSVSELPEGADRPIQVYVHVPEREGEGEYVRIQSLVQQPERWLLAKGEALRHLASAQESIDGMMEAQRLYGQPTNQGHVQRAKRSIASAREEILSVTVTA